jgi:energy-coupling factor transport system permease protein
MREIVMTRTPRSLHPGAWWIWAIGLAVVATRTTNPLLLGLLIGVASLVVVARREDAPWSRAFGLYLRLAILIVTLRVVLRIVLGGDFGTTMLFTLPEVALPDWVAGIRIGGAVSAESILAAGYDGLRLAAVLVCFGAANCLANPRRLLRLLPNALYEIGAAVTVAVSVAPQLAESVARVRRAQRLRTGGRIGPRRLLVPVLEDALDRSISLAAAMDARGYGRVGAEPASRRRMTSALLVVGLLGACVGLYGLLDTGSSFALGLSSLLGGLALMSIGVIVAGRRTRHTRYRPDRWGTAESVVAGSGVTAVALTLAGALVDPAGLYPSVLPLAWPTLAPIATLGLLIAALPAVLAPMPPLRAAARSATERSTAHAAGAIRP